MADQSSVTSKAEQAAGQAQIKKDDMMNRAAESCQEGKEQAGETLQQTGDQVRSMAQGAGDQMKSMAQGATDAVKNAVGMGENTNSSGTRNP